MSGSTWPTLVAGARAKASEVEAKFDWVEQDFVPMASGTKTDAAYDLGTSSFRWRDGYFSRQVTAGNGTVSSVSYGKTGDASYGLWFPASAVALSVAGAEIFRARSTGIKVTTTGTNDSQLEFDSSGTSWSIGNDVSDSNKYKLSRSSGLGTNDYQVATVNGEITKPLQPCFLAHLTTGSAAVAIGAATTTVIFAVETYDQNSDYNNATGVFTAPVTGKYLFNVQIGYTTGNGTTRVSTQLITTTIPYINTLFSHTTSSGAPKTSAFSVIADMSAGETAFVATQADTTTGFTLYSASGSRDTFWTGALLV